MAERSLKIVNPNTNFMGRVATTIKNILVPTKVGMNSFFLSIKRSNYIKTYKALEKVKETPEVEKREEAEKKYKEAYDEYLEAVDKYIMDSIYSKVSAEKATKYEQNALSEYYKISTYKNENYDEYRYKKQLFLLALDYKILKVSGKKMDEKYEEVYSEKATRLYRDLLKNYSIRLIDTTTTSDAKKNEIYMGIFKALADFVKEILPLEMQYSKTAKYNSIQDDIDRYNGYVGKLDESEKLERRIILLNLSRTLFTHSLQLSVVEECYLKLLRDTRILLSKQENRVKQEKVFEMIKYIINEYKENILKTKIYWEDKHKKEEFENFEKELKEAETVTQRDIIYIIQELKEIRKINEKKNLKVINIYKQILGYLGTKVFFGYEKFEEGKKIFARKVEIQNSTPKEDEEKIEESEVEEVAETKEKETSSKEEAKNLDKTIVVETVKDIS